MLKDLLKGKCRDITPKGREAALSCVGYDVIVDVSENWEGVSGSIPVGSVDVVKGNRIALKSKIDAMIPVRCLLRLAYTSYNGDEQFHLAENVDVFTNRGQICVVWRVYDDKSFQGNFNTDGSFDVSMIGK